MEQSLKLNIQEEEFIFDDRRAIYWPRKKTLILADLHWGKTHYLRQHGVAISDNVLEADLQRLRQLIEDYEVRTLLVLGDLIHHEKSLEPDLVEKLTRFRHDNPCELILLKGNHDRYTSFPPSWGIIEESEFKLGSFLFHHEYSKTQRKFQFSGHIHPMIRLRAGNDSLRFPAFILSEKFCHLPAFSYLTGGQDIRLTQNEKGIVITKEGLVLL